MSDHARDHAGRVIGTAHDFQGWCELEDGHDGPHAAWTDTAIAQPCGIAVALIGDLSNWKPIGILDVPGVQR